MGPRSAVSGVLLLLALGAGACTAGGERFGLLGRWLGRGGPPPVSQPVSVPLIDLDSTTLPWAQSEEYFIVVRRSCRTVDVYHWGDLIRRYPAVFGRNSAGSKLYEGDRRTPAGFYTIIEKRWHPRWARFMLLDYPNVTDGQRYAEAFESGDLPDENGHIPGIGGAIGIHGSDKQDLNARGIDWTLGCISLNNRDAIELDALVPVGTPVWIHE